MDTIGIEAFLAVVRTGTFVRAAQQLHLSQSTISHRLKNLETSIGFQLLARRRGAREATLTREGEGFLSVAERWERLLFEAGRVRGERSLVLAIGASDRLNTFVLPVVYRRLLEDAPRLRLHIETLDAPEHYSSLIHDDIQVAFVPYERFIPGLVVEPFLSEPMVLVRRAHLPGVTSNIIDLEKQTLDPADEVFVDWGLPHRNWHQRWWQSVGGAIHIDRARMILPFLEDTRKWAIVPTSVALSFAAGGRCMIYRLSDPPPNNLTYRAYFRRSRSIFAESFELLESAVKALHRNHLEDLGRIPSLRRGRRNKLRSQSRDWFATYEGTH